MVGSIGMTVRRTAVVALVAAATCGCGINPAARDLARQERTGSARIDLTNMLREDMRGYIDRQSRMWRQLGAYARQTRFSSVQLTADQKNKVDGWTRQLRGFARRIAEGDTAEPEERETLRQIREHWHQVAGWLDRRR